MRPRAEFHPAAKHDLETAFHWYEQHREGLGVEFVRAVGMAIDRIREAPDGCQVIAKHTRKLVLRRFPYILLYAVEADGVLITAVVHVRRDPRGWSDRVRDSEPARSAIAGR